MECICDSSYTLSVLSPDLQNVDITLRILFRPKDEKLPWIYRNIGIDYDERVLPSITTEVLKAVVVCWCALFRINSCVGVVFLESMVMCWCRIYGHVGVLFLESMVMLVCYFWSFWCAFF